MRSKSGSLLVLAVIVGLLLPADAEAYDVPAGFVDQQVVDGISRPTAIDWMPNGDLLITSQEGMLYRSEGPGDADQLLDLTDRVCAEQNETGLLGLAVDPAFQSGERFIYLYYTARRGGCGANNRVNRVSRFEADSDGDVVQGSEEILIDKIPAPGGNHNGGDLQFDKDGLLYVSVGDGGQDLVTGQGQNNNGNARLLSLLNGKVLRIERDGSVPNDNPFLGNDSAPCAETGRAPVTKSEVKAEKKQRKKKARKRKKRRIKKKRRQLRNASVCQEIFATGLRNPFRIAFDPDDNSSSQRFFINDVGGGAWEEIDEGAKGADYGWNIREGPCPTGQTSGCTDNHEFRDPIFAYQHGSGCGTITGGAFVPDGSNWPAEFRDAYLFADFNCDTLFFIDDQNPGEAAEIFGAGSTAVHLAFGPDNCLYYTAFDGGGQVRRICPS